MSYTAIERKINYTMATGDNARLFDPINIEGNPCFSIQFFLSAAAGSPLNGEIHLKVSNIDSDTAPADSDFADVSSIPFSAGNFLYKITVDTAGNKTYYIFVGTGQGVGNVKWVTASFVKNNMSAGTIDKAILVGNLGNQ